MMQIVIDMPEGTFESVKRYYEQNQDCYALCAYVANGTPLPKGHGRLIDADSVKQLVRPIEGTDDSWGMTGETAIRLIHEAFNRAPTIIEADKQGSEDEA